MSKRKKKVEDLMKEMKEMEGSASEGNVDELYDKKQELEKVRKY
jgi:hypothetical protein